MSKSKIFVGMALVLSVAAFVLGLWPAVADALWEEETPIVQDSVELQKESAQARICLAIIDGISHSSSARALRALFVASPRKLGGIWEEAGCDDYLARVTK